ncbi:MAG: ribonuclease E activity regulator RraA [Methylococcales bacterium]|jgi:regulator of ribonuclease activity A|nr:ribonuclease E activity regulator RraA [Methylococcales bacterium]MBT3698348.1 ribonuclease E activity regulator RraA [Methylococcales bacterium]MBT3815026.1 ribonuclease E activity regulator RraA [Methylococcales bacterium]MBT4031408.1 ribonuclease E activity regulator RraA [Methylococcales bacterium]MBT4347587.1 ribonuclease E activity regulator RraA [Methylococcales bacterium]
MTLFTTDLCDAHSSLSGFQIAEPIFKNFGGNCKFSGQITTLNVLEDNVLVRNTLEQSVDHRVLVIDGQGSLNCALLGDNLALIAHENGWQGIVINGCIRDTEQINQLPIGIKALAAHPLKSQKKGTGTQGLVINFAGITFEPDHYIYSDPDGIVVSKERIR